MQGGVEILQTTDWSDRIITWATLHTPAILKRDQATVVYQSDRILFYFLCDRGF